MTCDACKWWKSPEPYEAGMKNPEMYARLFGRCDNPDLNDRDGVQFGPVNRVNGNPANACPDSSDTYEICFLTGPKFGCIHFYENPEPA